MAIIVTEEWYDVRARYRGRVYGLMAIPYKKKTKAIERCEQWRNDLSYVEFWVETIDPNGPVDVPPLPNAVDLINRIRAARCAEYERQKREVGIIDYPNLPTPAMLRR